MGWWLASQSVIHLAVRAGRRRLLGITLEDRNLNPSRGLLGRLAALNAASGFGDVSLMMQGTSRSHDEMLAAVAHFDLR